MTQETQTEKLNTNEDAKFTLSVPVAFFTFNRLDTAKQVFARIKEAKPTKLYLISDGPRAHVQGEDEKVNGVRAYLLDNIDWDCEVVKNFAEANMGCGKRMSSGITWVFENEEKAIFLEDDCVPQPTFFRYCQEMLEKYENTEEVMIVSGNNQIAYLNTFDGDYGFSHQANIWGWAAWRRTWADYDYDIKDWPEKKKLPVWKKIYNRKAYWTLMAEYDTMYRHAYDTWDYQVSYLLGKKEAYCVIPKVNLVSNAGFDGQEFTHTADMPEWMDQRSYPMTFPINHPEKVTWSKKYDEEFSNRDFCHALTVHAKHILGMDVNKSIFAMFRK